jgi:hypothetical protein
LGLLAVAAGWSVAAGYPLFALGLGGLLMLATAPSRQRMGMVLLLLVLVGYVVADRVFAYLSLSVRGVPLFPGELAIVVGLVTLGGMAKPKWRIARVWALAFIAWACVVFVSSLGKWPILDSIRDFSLVYYAIFAVFAFRVPWERLGRRGLSIIAVVFVAQLSLATLVVLRLIPAGAFGSLSDVVARTDVQGTNLLGGAAFFLLADDRLRWGRVPRLLMSLACLLLAVLLASRAVFLAEVFLVVTLLLSARRSLIRALIGYSIVGILLLLTLGVGPTGLQVDTLHRGETGITTVIERITSGLGLGGDSAAIAENSAKTRFRTYWWRTLWEHDLAHPTWLVTGRGFGPNLAVEVGYAKPNDPRPLRAPHSIFVDVFARLGILGIVAWTAWMLSIAGAGLKVSRRPTPEGALSTWMLLYWACYLIVASLGVVIESPFGAVPFYFLTGALIRLACLPHDRHVSASPSHATRPNQSFISEPPAGAPWPGARP